jgi:hypothetical protein
VIVGYETSVSKWRMQVREEGLRQKILDYIDLLVLQVTRHK